MHSLKKYIFVFALSSFSCRDGAEDIWINFSPFVAAYDSFQLEKTEIFSSAGESKGTIGYMNELSGLAFSRLNKNALWAHNDSGNANIIYLIDENTATLKAAYRLIGINNDDWEDIAVGPGPRQGTSYVYLADIGDNKSEKTERLIYRFPEPIYVDAHAGKTIDVQLSFETIKFKYPDGPHNAETLLLDPVQLDLYVVTKSGANSLLFVARYPQPVSSLNVLTKVGTFPFREATGGDISSNGKQVLIKSYDQIFYWENKNNEPLWKLLSQAPVLASYNPVEAQGEAITWNNNGYFTASENKNSIIPKLYYYPIK